MLNICCFFSETPVVYWSHSGCYFEISQKETRHQSQCTISAIIQRVACVYDICHHSPCMASVIVYYICHRSRCMTWHLKSCTTSVIGQRVQHLAVWHLSSFTVYDRTSGIVYYTCHRSTCTSAITKRVWHLSPVNVWDIFNWQVCRTSAISQCVGYFVTSQSITRICHRILCITAVIR